ncbi:hypothetical protein [Streptomyces sp. 840.1]|uniref:hypothetical protein n=1 Tax=Streptomyces sp. 840.1 TaxID=2485152 RepID=UPI0011CDF20A|nr:hypothetical protein [Streptomyces sp. 840.1]
MAAERNEDSGAARLHACGIRQPARSRVAGPQSQTAPLFESGDALLDALRSLYSSASKPGGPHGIAGMEPDSRTEPPAEPDRTGPIAGPQVRENHWIVATVRGYRAAVPRRLGKGVPLYTV